MSDASQSPVEPAVVLLSGGLDSTTVLAIASREAKQQVHALSFAYGQRHAVELGCAARQAARFGVVAHELIDLSQFGRMVARATSLVAGSTLAVPHADARTDASEIPSTYVPARNTLFLSYALAWAEAIGSRDIWIGVNAVDYSGYPDCRPEFIAAFARMATLATKMGVEGGGEGRAIQIHTPLIDLSKRDIIARGLALGVDYADTTSCYDPREHDGRALACGRCESCELRRAGFAAAGIADPTRYV